jgi:hypothetical protein
LFEVIRRDPIQGSLLEVQDIAEVGRVKRVESRGECVNAIPEVKIEEINSEASRTLDCLGSAGGDP